MASKINKENLEESYTTWGGSADRAGSFYTPTGPIGKFFAKFFATKAQLPAVKAMDRSEPYPTGGDTIVSTEIVKDSKDSEPAVGGVSRNPVLPQLELNRRRRYKEYDKKIRIF